MTEHIIQFGVGIDDEAIVESVKAKAEHIILRDIEMEVLKKIFTGRYYGNKAVHYNRDDMPEVDAEAEFSRFAEGIIKETMSQYKDEIVDTAAQMLAESFKRTKAWKEATGEVIGGGA